MDFSRICKLLQVGGGLVILFAIMLWGGRDAHFKYMGLSFGGVASLALGTLGHLAAYAVTQIRGRKTALRESPEPHISD